MPSAKAGVILSPSLAVYQDIDKYKGAYWAASIGHGFGLGESVNVDLTGGLGLGSKSFIGGYFGGMMSIPDTDLGASVSDFYVRAGVPFHPIPFLSITPSVTYTSLLGDAKKALDNDESLYSGKKTNVVWGLAAAGGTSSDASIAGSVGVNVVTLTNSATVGDERLGVAAGDADGAELEIQHGDHENGQHCEDDLGKHGGKDSPGPCSRQSRGASRPPVD